MKHIPYLFAILIVVIACGEKTEKKNLDELIESKDLDGLKNYKNQVIISYDSVSNLLHKVEEAIIKLDTTKNLPVVTSYVVRDTSFSHYIELQGNVDTRQNTVVFSEYSGILTKLYVSEGQQVKAGQVLAKVDDGGLAQQLGQIEVQYALAKTTYERQKRLWERKIGSEIQYLEAKTQMESQEQAMAQLKAQLGKTLIKAPFSGIVDDVIVKQGSVVSAGMTEIARVVNLSNMYVRADVPESYLGKITKGTAVKVHFRALGTEVAGKVRQIGNFINPNNRTFYIEVGISNEDQSIKPNLVANLEVNDYQKEEALIIPNDIIQEDAIGERFVFILEEKEHEEAEVTRRKITTGYKQGDFVEVLSGLVKGEQIVKEGGKNMRDGVRVKVKGNE